VVYLPEGAPAEDHIRAQAVERSIALHTLGGYWHVPAEDAGPAVIVGYAAPASHLYRPALNGTGRAAHRTLGHFNWTSIYRQNWTIPESHLLPTLVA
jgi:hypothetical protein